MPHFVIEFSEGQVSDAQVEAMLDAVHAAAVETGLFEASHIRVRAMPYAYYRVAGEQQAFIHARLHIHAGRTDEQKKALSAAVLAALRAQAWPAKVITVEVVDMDRSTYAKYASDQ